MWKGVFMNIVICDDDEITLEYLGVSIERIMNNSCNIIKFSNGFALELYIEEKAKGNIIDLEKLRNEKLGEEMLKSLNKQLISQSKKELRIIELNKRHQERNKSLKNHVVRWKTILQKDRNYQVAKYISQNLLLDQRKFIESNRKDLVLKFAKKKNELINNIKRPNFEAPKVNYYNASPEKLTDVSCPIFTTMLNGDE